MDLTTALLAEIGTGSIGFDRLVERALYDDEFGFYSVSGAAGRHRDFVTSVEIGPLFAEMVARALDRYWAELGHPDPFQVVEVGAGVATLARGVRRARPGCIDALHYTMVERSARLAAQQRDWVEADSGSGRFATAAILPDGPHHVVFANELLDNIAFGIVERTADGWVEVRVEAAGDRLAERLGDVEPALDARLRALAPDAAVGQRAPVADEAAAWVQGARARSDIVLAIDYGAPTAHLVARGGWLRTYARQSRGTDPLDELGRRDITIDVPTDQLPAPNRNISQAEWLVGLGVESVVEAARAQWNERAKIGDIAAIRARSAVGEHQALVAPDGLGAFRVLDWRR